MTDDHFEDGSRQGEPLGEDGGDESPGLTRGVHVPRVDLDPQGLDDLGQLVLVLAFTRLYFCA